MLAGHAVWSGRLYGAGLLHTVGLGLQPHLSRIVGQRSVSNASTVGGGPVNHVLAMPEWLLIIGLLASLSAMRWWWPKMVWVLPFLVLAVGITAYQVAVSAGRATRFSSIGSSPLRLFGLRCITLLLCLLQRRPGFWGRVSPRTGVGPIPRGEEEFLPGLGSGS